VELWHTIRNNEPGSSDHPRSKYRHRRGTWFRTFAVMELWCAGAGASGRGNADHPSVKFRDRSNTGFHAFAVVQLWPGIITEPGNTDHPGIKSPGFPIQLQIRRRFRSPARRPAQ